MYAPTTPVYPPLGVVGDCNVVSGCEILRPVAGIDFVTEEAGTGLTFVTWMVVPGCVVEMYWVTVPNKLKQHVK